MKSLLESEVRQELINRINLLNQNTKPLWGKMNVYQMVKHCAKWEDMPLGKRKYKQVFLGKIFGKMALNKVLKDETPLGKNSPTIPTLIIQEKEGDLELEKQKWISQINEYPNIKATEIMHPFFGKLTWEQMCYFSYKHSDHHLRQFGV